MAREKNSLDRYSYQLRVKPLSDSGEENCAAAIHTLGEHQLPTFFSESAKQFGRYRFRNMRHFAGEEKGSRVAPASLQCADDGIADRFDLSFILGRLSGEQIRHYFASQGTFSHDFSDLN
jgi:hypothetical protein